MERLNILFGIGERVGTNRASFCWPLTSIGFDWTLFRTINVDQRGGKTESERFPLTSVVYLPRCPHSSWTSQNITAGFSNRLIPFCLCVISPLIIVYLRWRSERETLINVYGAEQGWNPKLVRGQQNEALVERLNMIFRIGERVGTYWGGFSLVLFCLGFYVELVQNHKRWSTLIQRIPFRSSSQVNVETVQIPFSPHIDQRWWSWTTPSRTRGKTKPKKTRTWLRC